MITEGGEELSEKVRYGFKLVLARVPDAEEERRIADLYRTEEKYYADNMEYAATFSGNKENPVEHAAWTAVANVLLNLDETLTRE